MTTFIQTKYPYLILFHLLIGLVCISSAHALPRNRLISAVFMAEQSEERIEIKTTAEPRFTVTTLDSPKRIICTIKDSYFTPVHWENKVKSRHIRRIRVSQNTKNQTRVVLDMITQKPIDINTFQGPDNTLILTLSIPLATEAVTKKEFPALKPFLIAQVGVDSIIKTDTRHLSAVLPEPRQKTPAVSEPAWSVDEQINKETTQQDRKTSDNSMLAANFDDSIFDTADKQAPPKKDTVFSGSVLVRASHDVSDDGNSEHKYSLKNKTILKFAHKKNLVVSGLSDYLYFGDDNDTDDYHLDLHETYYRHITGPLTMTAGKQIKRWGKSDKITAIDTLNPQNITEFIIPDYEERKIPVWMADIAYRTDTFFIEGIFIPFFEPNRFDYFGTDWAFFNHIKENISDSSLTPAQKAYFSGIGVNENEPDSNTDSFEYAFRAGGTVEQFDFGFTYHWTNEDVPYIKNFPVKNLNVSSPGAIKDILSNLGSLVLTNESIEAEYLRTHVFGFEFETILSTLGIRGEAAFKENESFLTQTLTSVRKPTLSWIIGADYTSADEWYFNLQFAHQHISNYENTILIHNKDNYSILGEVSKPILSDWLTVSAESVVMLSDSSFYLSPRLIWTYIENLEVSFGLNLFEGSDSSLFGQYDDNDQFFICAKYLF